MNLKSILEETAQKYGKKAALVLGERRMSYSELDEASNKIANALINMGVQRNDHVAMILSNSPEFVTVFFGIIKAGATAFPLDTRYTTKDLSILFEHFQPKVLLAEDSFIERLSPTLPCFSSIQHVVHVGDSREDKFLGYQQIMVTGSAQRVEVETPPESIANVSYTSGPISRPQGAMLSHQSLLASAITSANIFQQNEKDVTMLFALPMFHMFGLATVLLASLYKGSTVIIVPGTGISISSLMEAIEREKGTLLMGVPYIFALAINIARREGMHNDLSSLRLCASGGAPLPVNTIRQFRRYYGFTINDIWGLTEAVSQVTGLPINATIKLGAAGKALPGWEIKIVDDNGNELPSNQNGEIILRGPIMKGYYNNPQATAEAIRNGWLYTGDIGRIDLDGYLFVTGRKKQMIILKGQNIYPREIEEVLCTHPKIAAARVSGVPDKLRGEIVRAVIQLKDGMATTEQEIRHFCQERMPDYKLPRQIIFAASLPQVDPIKMWQ